MTASRLARVKFSRRERPSSRASCFRSSGTSAIPARTASRGLVSSSLSPSSSIVPVLARSAPNNKRATSVRPEPDCGSAQGDCGSAGVELADVHLDDLTAYIALLGVSARRSLDDAQAQAGEGLFGAIGCTDCHVPTFRTSPFHPHAELRDQEIHPYTDLLLHDMGPGLASTLQEGGAGASEWRTPPLWNIGLTAGVSGGEAYLHDGRARTLDEAIRWHGGEGQEARSAYESLTTAQRDSLLAFLRTL